MRERLKTKINRLGFNLFPVYFGTGAHITYIADDFHEVHIKLPFSWRTRNYVGTIFGGSMYAAVDPVYMVMLIKMLGPGYVVWDKSANIQFKRSSTQTLRAKFLIAHEEIEKIKSELTGKKSLERTYRVDLINDNGKTHATIEKTIYISRRFMDRNGN